MEENRVINANPTKDFFISMIARDINVKDAILELVDNCLDGAIKLRPNSDFQGLSIYIDISDKEFSIFDNCGGISIDIAENYAFRFGRPKNAKNVIDNSTGIFGIGMKRALFKLGKEFTIESTTLESSFLVNIDVDKWADDDDNWNFNFKDVKENCKNELKDCGTKIVIKKLHEGIKNDFIHNYFINELINHIQQFVSLSIEKGICIKLNNVELQPIINEIFESKSLKPAFENYSVGGVDIKILAGIGDKGTPDKAGWYIYCNGRLVLSADKSQITGWEEDNSPKFHPTYARFRGFVFFESKDASKLPWNTAKTSVDSSSPVFINAKVKMKSMFKSVADSLKKIKIISNEDKRQEMEELIDSLPKISISPMFFNILNVKNYTNKITAKFLENIPRIENSEVSISFKRPIEEVEKVKELLGVSSNKLVGEKTFEYFLKKECND